MRKYALTNAGGEEFSEQEANELFALGLLHDIDYQFLDEKDYSKHEQVGGEFLKNQGYKYWQEVFYHGVANSSNKSKFLDVLNWTDMHIDSVGNFVSFDGRLKEISERYNVPIDKLNSKAIVDELKARGFN